MACDGVVYRRRTNPVKCRHTTSGVIVIAEGADHSPVVPSVDPGDSPGVECLLGEIRGCGPAASEAKPKPVERRIMVIDDLLEFGGVRVSTSRKSSPGVAGSGTAHARGGRIDGGAHVALGGF